MTQKTDLLHFRAPPEIREHLKRIKAAYDLPNLSAAMRLSIQQAARDRALLDEARSQGQQGVNNG